MIKQFCDCCSKEVEIPKGLRTIEFDPFSRGKRDKLDLCDNCFDIIKAIVYNRLSQVQGQI